MSTTTTTIFTQISGRDLTAQSITEENTIKGKFERTFSGLISTDGEISIPITKYGTLTKILVNGTSCTLKITLADASVLTLPIAGLFHWTVSSTFVSTIDTITISTSSLVAVDATVIMFGI